LTGFLRPAGPTFAPPTVAVLPRSAIIRAKRRRNSRFQPTVPLASTLAPYLQMINYRGRFSPIGGI